MSDVCSTTRSTFREKFGCEPALEAYAPGRVNIIGEHTDYNGGFVLPCAIKYGTAMSARLNGTDRMRIVACDLDNDYDEFTAAAGTEKHPDKLWVNYLRGMTSLICKKYGTAVRGLDVTVSGDIPKGAGLSSSASLEVAFGRLVSGACGLEIPLQEIALMGQAAEAYIGMKCGIMDQTISACGKEGHALCIDCRSLELTQVPVPADFVIMVINSNVKHQLVGSEYNDRRASCEKAAAVMGLKLLREADLKLLEQYRSGMDEVSFRRARHVITEDERVQQAIDAFRNARLPELSELMYGSHCSMRDDFEITIPEIDALVEIIRNALGAGKGAVRMTGGGFGGSVVAVVQPADIAKVKEAVGREYRRVSGRDASIFETRACAGSRFSTL